MHARPLRPELARKPTPPERRVLCAALGLVPRGVESLEETADVVTEIDWTFLLTYARQHLALPLLACAAREAPGFRRALPGEVKDALEAAAVQNELQNRWLLADLAATVALLRRRGIASIALKGAGLLARHEPLVRTRQTDDIDLWVEPAHATDAHTLLRAEGYVDAAPRTAVARYDGGPSPHPALDGDYYELPALLCPRGTPLEIHRRPPTAARRTAWRDALDAALLVDVNGVAVHVRDGAAMLRDLAGHVVVHHRAVPWLWPRHLVDVTRIVEEARVLGRDVTGSTRGRVLERGSVALTFAVLDQMRDVSAGVSSKRGPEGALARRLVFPIGAQLGWGVYRLFNLGLAELRGGPRALGRALWPSPAFLESRGFDTSRGAWRAHAARLLDILARAGSR